MLFVINAESKLNPLPTLLKRMVSFTKPDMRRVLDWGKVA
jgi:hypothetical protein